MRPSETARTFIMAALEAPAPYTGPVRDWRDAVDATPAVVAVEILRRVLRTRRPALPFQHYGRQWLVKRAELRDYLRERMLPRWMRLRPVPAASGDTICFRRPNRL